MNREVANPYIVPIEDRNRDGINDNAKTTIAYNERSGNNNEISDVINGNKSKTASRKEKCWKSKLLRKDESMELLFGSDYSCNGMKDFWSNIAKTNKPEEPEVCDVYNGGFKISNSQHESKNLTFPRYHTKNDDIIASEYNNKLLSDVNGIHEQKQRRSTVESVSYYPQTDMSESRLTAGHAAEEVFDSVSDLCERWADGSDVAATERAEIEALCASLLENAAPASTKNSKIDVDNFGNFVNQNQEPTSSGIGITPSIYPLTKLQKINALVLGDTAEDKLLSSDKMRLKPSENSISNKSSVSVTDVSDAAGIECGNIEDSKTTHLYVSGIASNENVNDIYYIDKRESIFGINSAQRIRDAWKKLLLAKNYKEYGFSRNSKGGSETLCSSKDLSGKQNKAEAFIPNRGIDRKLEFSSKVTRGISSDLCYSSTNSHDSSNGELTIIPPGQTNTNVVTSYRPAIANDRRQAHQDAIITSYNRIPRLRISSPFPIPMGPYGTSDTTFHDAGNRILNYFGAGSGRKTDTSSRDSMPRYVNDACASPTKSRVCTNSGDTVGISIAHNTSDFCSKRLHTEYTAAANCSEQVRSAWLKGFKAGVARQKRLVKYGFDERVSRHISKQKIQSFLSESTQKTKTRKAVKSHSSIHQLSCGLSRSTGKLCNALCAENATSANAAGELSIKRSVLQQQLIQSINIIETNKSDEESLLKKSAERANNELSLMHDHAIRWQEVEFLLRCCVELRCRFCGCTIPVDTFGDHLIKCCSADTTTTNPNRRNSNQSEVTKNKKPYGPGKESLFYISSDVERDRCNDSAINQISNRTIFDNRQTDKSSKYSDVKSKFVNVYQSRQKRFIDRHSDSQIIHNTNDTADVHNEHIQQREMKSVNKCNLTLDTKGKDGLSSILYSDSIGAVREELYICEKLQVLCLGVIKEDDSQLYKIRVEFVNTSWSVMRRFREVLKLHNNLRKYISDDLFPHDSMPIKCLRTADKDTLEERRSRLERYLNGLVKRRFTRQLVPLRCFLLIDDNLSDNAIFF